ncbi:MAG: RNA pseudouridine synthase [Cellvibrionales bacterium]|nr:RNA pseudouridine synthase [Cellvibrionales bacterium]
MKNTLQAVTSPDQIIDPTRFIFKKNILSGDLTIMGALQGLPLSNSTLKDAMEKGALWLTQGKKTSRIRRSKKTLQSGDCISLYYDQNVLNTPPKKPRLIHDNQNWSVWFKPKGMLSQGTSWGDHHCLYRMVAKQLDRAVYPIHRLDRATSGIMLIGHNKSAAKQLTHLFETRAITKMYRARVTGDARVLVALKNHLLTHPIDGKPAKTEVVGAEYENNETLLTLQLHTGRKHQIRKHLSAAGFPIIGDKLYGEANSEGLLQLEAFRLSFTLQNTNYDFAN